jgi:hypothetical protein
MKRALKWNGYMEEERKDYMKEGGRREGRKRHDNGKKGRDDCVKDYMTKGRQEGGKKMRRQWEVKKYRLCEVRKEP